MSNLRISVVVTTCFRDLFLAECLASLAAQSLTLHEVMVVDDGGSGTARHVVEQFGPRFRYLWQPNSGMQNARNNGTRASTGDWTAFLDDDDLWLPERHALIADLISTGEVDLISGDFIKFAEGQLAPCGVFNEIERQSPGFWAGISRQPEAVHCVIGSFPTTRLLPVHPFWPSTLVIRNDLFARLNGWNESLKGIKAEDFEFVFRALRIGQLGLIWTPTLHYRIHAGNDSGSALSIALGRTHVWETLLVDPNTLEEEKEALVNAVNQSLHEIVFSAFSVKKYETVMLASKKINKLNLSMTEKIKIFISRFLINTGVYK